MALVSKAKAAKLAGVSRTTIHRYATEGKLSMTGEQIDTSELMRVFGQISEQGGGHVQDGTTGHDVTVGGQGGGQAQIRLLEQVVEDLRKDRDHWRTKSDELVEVLKAEQENTRLLTHQSPANRKGDYVGVLLVTGFLAVAMMIGWLVWQLQA